MASGSGLTDPANLPGVLDAEGYAICPDCGTRINCGTAGLANLNRQHRGTKTCRETAQKRDRLQKQRKNGSILSFLQKRPTPVPATVAPAAILQSRPQPAPCHTEIGDLLPVKSADDVTVIRRLRDLIVLLPNRVPEAKADDILAIFGGQPAGFDDPGLPSEDIWQEIMNPTLKRVLGWGTEMDLVPIIKRGPLGMDGFLAFIEYFVTVRKVPEFLVEGKLEHLIVTLEKLIKDSQQIPSTAADVDGQQLQAVVSYNRSPVLVMPVIMSPQSEVIDVDTIVELPVITHQKRCSGFILPIPEGQSPHTSYPFAIHDSLPTPWDYTVSNDVMTLHAHACDRNPGSNKSCAPCQSLEENSIIKGILKRMKHGILESTNYMFHGFSSLNGVVQRRNTQIRYLQLQGLNQARKLIGQGEVLSDYKRFGLAIASGRYERVDRLMHIALKQRRGIRGILTMYEAAASGVYKPKSYTERDDMRGLLFWRLGGIRLAEIAHRSLDLPGMTTLRTRTIVPPIILSPSKPTIHEVQKNTKATFESIKAFLDGHQVVHQVLMFDEIATEKRIRLDRKLNMFLGVCRQHGGKTALEFNTEEDLEELFQCLDDGEIHAAGEATIGALGLLSNNHRLYPARPILVSADCKKETGLEHAIVLQSVIEGVDATNPTTHLRIVSIASDGETRRGSSLVHLTFKRMLSPESNIFSLLECISLLNLHVGDDDITADKDWKHVIKRFRNLLLRARGIVVMGVRITPSILRVHLQEAGCTAEHIHAVMNPEDQQDVKLAFDLLKDIWTLPVASEKHSPGFHSGRESLRILGRLLFHTVFPYICVDLSLSEQIEHLSAAIHLALALYRQSRSQFLPTLLYSDLAIMIKNVIFCVAKAKVDSPDSSFWIMLLGTDRLEELFGVLRTMIGTDANLDVLQIGERITGAIEVLNILAKYPEWDHSRELPDTTDHIKPGSWKGDTCVRNVSLQTSWKRGRRLINAEYPLLAEILKEVDVCPGADILSPFGKLLVNAPLDDEDIDESLDIAEAMPLDVDFLGSDSESTRVEVEDLIASDLSEDRDNEPVDTSSIGTPKGFDRFVTIGGKQILKSRALALRSKYRKKSSSTDRLKRVQEIERYSQKPTLDDSDQHGSSLFGASCLMNHDPIGTLVVSEGRIWLCVGEINNILHDSQSVDSISLEILAEGTVTVSFQVLGLRPAKSDDDSTLQYDWRSYTLSEEKTCTVPGRFIQPLDAEPEISITRSPFYLMKSSVLVAIAAALFERIQPDAKKLTVFKRTREFPEVDIKHVPAAYVVLGKACFLANAGLEILDPARNGTDICPRCSPEVPLDPKLAQRVLAHIGAHVLYDKTIQRKAEPCGLCLKAALMCKIYLTKGKGANGTLKIDKSRSSGCSNLISFTYSVAAQSKPSSPCSNVPLRCPLCPKTGPAVWRYNWKAHFENAHPHATYSVYAQEGELSNFEWSQMKKWWRDRQKVPAKRMKKMKGLTPLEVSTVHISGGALGITLPTDDNIDDLVSEQEQDFNDAHSDENSELNESEEEEEEEEEVDDDESEPFEELIEGSEALGKTPDTGNEVEGLFGGTGAGVEADGGGLDTLTGLGTDTVGGILDGRIDENEAMITAQMEQNEEPQVL
ncbi:hypothetical protein DXG01_004635 [Tephrocybe rancida]|nr:hypothetical protein DXG01_004635 [Tephrocybe rancida]